MGKFLAGVAATLVISSQLYGQSGDRCEGPGGVQLDDGFFEASAQCDESDCYFAQLLTPPSYPSLLTKACVCWKTTGAPGQRYDLVVFDDDGSGGIPGTRLDSKEVDMNGATGFFEYFGHACADLNIIVESGGVYIGPNWSTEPADPGHEFYVCLDGNNPHEAEAYYSTEGVTWTDITSPSVFQALGIRAEFAHQGGGCIPSATTACLLSGRFQVEVEWTDFSAVTRDAFVASAGTSDTALFYWTNPANWELLIKGIDACSYNGKFWIYFAAATNVGYRVTVTDTQAGGTPKVYTNAVGNLAQATNDIDAFDCP